MGGTAGTSYILSNCHIHVIQNIMGPKISRPLVIVGYWTLNAQYYQQIGALKIIHSFPARTTLAMREISVDKGKGALGGYLVFIFQIISRIFCFTSLSHFCSFKFPTTTLYKQIVCIFRTYTSVSVRISLIVVAEYKKNAIFIITQKRRNIIESIGNLQKKKKTTTKRGWIRPGRHR